MPLAQALQASLSPQEDLQAPLSPLPPLQARPQVHQPTQVPSLLPTCAQMSPPALPRPQVP